MEEKMGVGRSEDTEDDRRTAALVNDQSAWKGFVLLGSIASHEFNFEEHGLTSKSHWEIFDALLDALEEQGIFANCNTLGLSEQMHSQEEARDLLIRWTVQQPAEIGVVRGFIRRVLLRLYRLAGQGV